MQLCEESGKKRKHVVVEITVKRRKNSSVNQLGEKCPKRNVKSTAFSPDMGQTESENPHHPHWRTFYPKSLKGSCKKSHRHSMHFPKNCVLSALPTSTGFSVPELKALEGKSSHRLTLTQWRELGQGTWTMGSACVACICPASSSGDRTWALRRGGGHGVYSIRNALRTSQRPDPGRREHTWAAPFQGS